MVQTRTRKYVVAAALAGLAYLLYYISFPVIPGFTWMKVDFSDLPILLAFFILGPADGLLVAVLRSLLYFVLTGFDAANFIGIAAGFLATVTFVSSLYRFLAVRDKSVTNIIMAGAIATITLAVVMSLANWAVVTPLYMRVIGLQLPFSIGRYVLTVVAPFNIIKGILLTVAFGLIYRHLENWIEHKHREY